MKKQKIFKIILNVIFIPLIISFSIGVIGLIEYGFEYVLTAIIMDIILIVSYIKLKNKINNIEIKSSKNNLLKNLINNIMNNKIESNEKQILEQSENDKWTKITKDFFISEEYRKLKINNKEIDFNLVVDVELLEDESSISNTIGTNKTKGKNNKHIAPLKGLIGFGIFGPVGAIIGGTSGKADVKYKTKVNTVTLNVNYCTNLSIKITLNDMHNPIIIYRFIKRRISKNSTSYKRTYEDAQKCISIVKLIIKENNTKTLT